MTQTPAAARARPAHARPGTSSVSVIVPTRDRPLALARCLSALEAQDPPVLEMVVVDDASRDAGAVAAVVTAFRRARLVRADGRGPAAARNAGIRTARGTILCFTDDDCTPHPRWSADLGEVLAAGADAVVGRAVAPVDAGAGAVAWQVICDHLTATSLQRASSAVTFGPSCTLACPAATARAVPFDERFPAAAGEDRDWCARLLASGRALGFAPRATVIHHHELALRAFWRQQVNYGRGALRFRRAHRAAPEPPSFYLRLLARGMRKGPAVGAFVALAQIAVAAGMLVEALAEGRRRRGHPPSGG